MRVVVWLVIVWFLSFELCWQVVAQNAESTQPAPAAQGSPSAEPSNEAPNDSGDALPWQPGLGRPLKTIPGAQVPAIAQRIDGARPMGNSIPAPVYPPISGATYPPGSTLPYAAPLIPPQSSSPAPMLGGLVTPQALASELQNQPPPNINATAASNPQTVSGPNPLEQSVVVPAAFLEADDQESPESAGQPDSSGGNQQVVDSRITTVSKGLEVLPNRAGQIWRTYDISPYTHLINNTTRPQQAVIDWILNETGTDLWFTEPMGILNASRDQLHIYHTPEIHRRVKSIVDRLVYSQGRPQVMGLRLVTIVNPNWRSAAFTMMQPVEVHSPGVEAWLISKENAALLANTLRNRADYQEHSAGDLTIRDGQKYLLSQTRPVNFTRALTWVNDGVGRYQPINDRIDEGYSLEFSALNSLDGQSMEAIVGCKIDQIEKMQKVSIDLQTPDGQTQPVELQIPQMVSWRLEERFRWPSDQVLLLSCGVVATPGPQREPLMGIPSIFKGTRRRADALLFIEYKGPAPQTSATANVSAAGQMMPVSPRR